jgi:hypothetical protein
MKHHNNERGIVCRFVAVFIANFLLGRVHINEI